MAETSYAFFGVPGKYRYETFMLLNRVFEREIIGVKGANIGQEKWSGDRRIFGETIALDEISARHIGGGKYLLRSANVIVDDGDTELRVDNNFFDSLQDDPYVDYVMTRFRNLYESHDHIECIARRTY